MTLLANYIEFVRNLFVTVMYEVYEVLVYFQQQAC